MSVALSHNLTYYFTLHCYSHHPVRYILLLQHFWLIKSSVEWRPSWTWIKLSVRAIELIFTITWTKIIHSRRSDTSLPSCCGSRRCGMDIPCLLPKSPSTALESVFLWALLWSARLLSFVNFLGINLSYYNPNRFWALLIGQRWP